MPDAGGTWNRAAYLAARSGRSTAASTAQPSSRPRASFQSVIDAVARIGMYSRDPQVARTATVYTAQRELARFDQSQDDQQALDAARRAEDRAGEERRMRFLARAMADEMVKRVQAQRGRAWGGG